MDIQKNIQLTPLNTLKLPGESSYFCSVTNLEELNAALQFAHDEQLSVSLIGAGSNTVINNNINGLLIKIDTRGIALQETRGDSVVIRIAAGENWHSLVEHCLKKGWYGIENLALIPGLVGAAPIQNIGAYGVELSDVLVAVDVLDIATGTSQTLSYEQCQPGYRDSAFKHELKGKFVITHVLLALSTTPSLNLSYPALAHAIAGFAAPTPGDVFRAVCDIRASKLPNPDKLPNAGSFFKNPVVAAGHGEELLRRYPDIPHYVQPGGDIKIPAAWLIDRAGWKGYRSGSVGVHDQQALVLVNYGGATGKELLDLANTIARDIEHKFGITLEIEPVILGAES